MNLFLGLFLPQGLCTSYSLCLECSSLNPAVLWELAHISPQQNGFFSPNFLPLPPFPLLSILSLVSWPLKFILYLLGGL